MAAIVLANGRDLPPLLFVTHRDLLRASIGEAAAAQALAAISIAPHSVAFLDELQQPSARECAQFVGAAIAERHVGVVLIGGYDVVPPLRLDVLSPEVRAQLSNAAIANEKDHFIVWSDAAYGDSDGDGLPELPVSRIPDGHSADLLRTALGASAPGMNTRFGIRNDRRPFAEEVYADVPGVGEFLISKPTRTAHLTQQQLDVDSVYFMLHGFFDLGYLFKGEAPNGQLTAFDTSKFDGRCPAVIFSGCCWSGLCGDPRAADAVAGQALIGRTPQQSIALSALKAGALAFIGCTGSHNSPVREPFDYLCQPLHRLFWQFYSTGTSPSLALFKAKEEYVLGIPHRFRDWNTMALEMKLLRAFTCLGLGW